MQRVAAASWSSGPGRAVGPRKCFGSHKAWQVTVEGCREAETLQQGQSRGANPICGQCLHSCRGCLRRPDPHPPACIPSLQPHQRRLSSMARLDIGQGRPSHREKQACPALSGRMWRQVRMCAGREGGKGGGGARSGRMFASLTNCKPPLQCGTGKHAASSQATCELEAASPTGVEDAVLPALFWSPLARRGGRCAPPHPATCST